MQYMSAAIFIHSFIPAQRAGSLSRPEESERLGMEIFIPLCTVEVALLCIQAVKVSEFCSGGWEFTI